MDVIENLDRVKKFIIINPDETLHVAKKNFREPESRDIIMKDLHESRNQISTYFGDMIEVIKGRIENIEDSQLTRQRRRDILRLETSELEKIEKEMNEQLGRIDTQIEYLQGRFS